MTEEQMPPRLRHNAQLSAAFMTQFKITSRYPSVRSQTAIEELDLNGLKPFGYNPAIIDDNGFLIMAYRFHHEKDLNTAVVLAQVDPTGEILSNRVFSILDSKSIEDPKLFHYKNQLWMSFVASTWPQYPPKCVVKYGKIVNGRLEDVVQPNIGKNDWSSMEKNWVFFTYEENLYCVYRTHEKQEIFWLSGIEPMAVHVCDGPSWSYGPIKGGTAPVEFDGAWLRFFHSTLDNEFTGHRRRYFVGAYTMQKKPPFKVLHTSTKPILYGSEIDDIKFSNRPTHWKANVAFPGGAVPRLYGWCLSVGVNDSACLLASIRPEQLNL